MRVDAVERKQRRAGANDKRRMAGGPAERPSHPPNARIIKPTTQSQSMEAYYRIPSRKIRKTRRHSRRPPACPHPHAGAPTPVHSPSLRPPRLPGSGRPRVLLVESNPSRSPLPHQSACVPASVSLHSHKNVRRERTVQIRTAPCDLMMASRTAYQSNPACPSSFLGPLTDYSLTDARTDPPRGLYSSSRPSYSLRNAMRIHVLMLPASFLGMFYSRIRVGILCCLRAPTQSSSR